jgi:transposase
MRRSTTPISKITFAGIDYHKRFCVIALGDESGHFVSHHKVVNDESEIRRFFEKYPGVKCAVETSRGVEWFIDLLRSMQIDLKVCNTNKLKLIAETSLKTDKVDSKVLLELLARDYLPLVEFPTAEQRLLKERLRWRIGLMRQCTRLKLKIHALLDKENKGHTKLFTATGRSYLQRVQLHPDRRVTLDKHLSLLEECQKRLNSEDSWIDKAASKDPRCRRLMTIPGIGALSALLLVAEIGRVERFSRAEQLSNYFGLVPCEDSSGGKRRLGAITKEGNGEMRWLLIQDAWRAVATSPELRKRFAAISSRRGKNVAITAIARRLCEIVFNVLRTESEYSPERLATATPRLSFKV